MPNRSHAFVCPNCEAEFKVVRVEAADDSPNYPVCCPACKTEFPGREKSGVILKYFLVKEPTRPLDLIIDSPVDLCGESSPYGLMANSEQDDRVTFRVDFADGTTSYMQIHAHTLSKGDHVAPIIAQERQQKGEIAKGKIASVSRLREIDPFLGPIRN